MAPGVIPLRFAIAGIEVWANPSVANRWAADLTIRSLVEVGGEIPAGRFFGAELAGAGRERFAFEDAFFTGCQTFRNAPLIQAAGRARAHTQVGCGFFTRSAPR